MSLVLWHRVHIEQASGGGSLTQSIASFAGFGLPLTVSNDVYAGGIVLDAKVTVEMGEGATADTFCVTLYGLPADAIRQLRSGYSSDGLKVTIRLGYFDDLGTRLGSRPVMTGRAKGVTTKIGIDGVTETVIEGQEEAGYLLRDKEARLDRPAALPRLKLVRDLLPEGVDLAPGSTIPGSVGDISVCSGNTLTALQQLAADADVPIIVRDGSVLLGNAVGRELAPIQVDPDRNLVARADTQTESPDASAKSATAAVRTGLNVTVLGHPELRAGQTVTVTGLDDVPAGPLRIGQVTHTYGMATGYICKLTLTAVAPGKRARVIGGVRGVVDRVQDVVDRGRSDHPAIDVGEVTAYRSGKDSKHVTDLNYGQRPQPGVSAPSVASPVDDDVKLHSKPLAAPFAFHKVGLVTPVYPGMRALLAHNRGAVDDAVVAGWLWSRQSGHEPPGNEPGDYWLALPTELDKDGLPTGKGANDLIDATGRRVVQVRALHVLVGGPKLPDVGKRPKTPADDTVTIEHHSGTKIEISSQGKVTITTNQKTLTLTNGKVSLKLDGAKVAVS
ncbi:hypothetical protein BN159_0106 [Streptomyces davaonensis JCM 4913]|uniref:Gp5/Type VI secretion system Vgr protein OB-fold domain-containing protein n=1 Tax=Streptomyces davaonensis (strain DSM 101723 / JCM 4913 / KCC S-0913 / 768) TaxID=1214101 RepID=K4QUP1_STRDJ|nr:hypothetical protein [Streptomyces davaonensis]CCK24485.1 hypothetical protein BN159_0106 [Streptomyces davaonensis JCM 4913]